MAKKLTQAERIIRLIARQHRQGIKQELAKYDLLSKPARSKPTRAELQGGVTPREQAQQLHDIRMARKLMGIPE